MRKLFLIPARSGSKGLPKKNIKYLNGKALINHSIDFARQFTNDNNICLSTDCDEIIECAEANNLDVKFKRPKHLASDTAPTSDVIKHAISFYESNGIFYDLLVLLQPTTPFRRMEDLQNMLDSWENNFDLFVSVKEAKDSPYFNLYEENLNHFLEKCKPSKYSRRQDVPKVYAMNGSIYIFNINSIKNSKIHDFKKVKKYLMKEPYYSIDIDNSFDWLIAETVVKNNLI